MLGPTNLPLRSPTELHLVNGPVAIPTGSPLQAVDDHTTWDPSLLGQLQAGSSRPGFVNERPSAQEPVTRRVWRCA